MLNLAYILIRQGRVVCRAMIRPLMLEAACNFQDELIVMLASHSYLLNLCQHLHTYYLYFIILMKVFYVTYRLLLNAAAARATLRPTHYTNNVKD